MARDGARKTGGQHRGQASRSKGFDPTDILSALNAARVKYMVVGGLAVILHGVDRHTWDLDLCVELAVDNLKALEVAIKRIGFARRVPAPIEGLADPTIRRLWTVERHMQVYSFHEPYGRSRVVDVMVKPLARFDETYRRRVIVRGCGVSIPLMPVDILMKMKRAAGRPQDLWDVAALKRLGVSK